MQILKWLLPLTLVLLAGCVVAPATVASGSAPEFDARGQPVVAPAPRLEHPGRPTRNGQFWIAGHWDWIDGRYQWQAGRWESERRELAQSRRR